jgi:Arc/MetJ family transcription regulator
MASMPGVRRLELCSTLCDDAHMVTNLDIDPRLLEQAVKVSGERTKTAAVTRALREYVARHEQRRIVELFAALDWDPQYDYKGERTR